MSRTYLDWNATAPLRPEARKAMIAAMDCLGNPSSVHSEGRAAKAIIEKSRGQVADLVGCDRDEVVFTSGATEALSIVTKMAWDAAYCSTLEHDAVAAILDPIEKCPYTGVALTDANGIYLGDGFVSGFGYYDKKPKPDIPKHRSPQTGLFALVGANAETGVVQPIREVFNEFRGETELAVSLCDATQIVGKMEIDFNSSTFDTAVCSSHKFGGPKGAGVLYIKGGLVIDFFDHGAGQEKGRRSGTENVIGIAGMGAAAEAAAKDLADGVWQIVEQIRNVFEERLLNEVPELIIFGKDVPRLPNTSYFAVPGWKAETQVMQMDLAGFAVSAGSACSSGKVKASRVLKAMGYDEITAGSAIRVSIGPSTTAQELDSFADAWLKEYRRFKARAA